MEISAADKLIQTFNLRTPNGDNLNDCIVPGQKQILDMLLNRQSPDGKKKIHIMAHTRYGKSVIIGAAVGIRAAVKKERWAIVAPTKEQAQIIMDYMVFFVVNDPILSQLLKVDSKLLKEEMLTQRRSRDHITFLNGGEVRTFSAKQTMGFGAPNIVMDEAGLIDDEDEARAYRMLGDSTDNFIVKIGNPWSANHFKDAFIDDEYYHINIDVFQGIQEGRVTEQHHSDVKKKPFYEELYLNRFPDEEARDKWGYLPLFTHNMIENAQTEEVQPFGVQVVGADPADAGENESVICQRSTNLAWLPFISLDTDSVAFAGEVAKYEPGVEKMYVDKQGVGSGTARLLQDWTQTKRKVVALNSGMPVDEKLVEDAKQYANLRAYMFWESHLWLIGGGKLRKSNRWKQLLAVKYKTNSRGQVQIVSKDDLRKRYRVYDLGIADAYSMTFHPQKATGTKKHTTTQVGGVEPMYPDLGI